jgi:ABC-2 type transport system ATP-binding protein
MVAGTLAVEAVDLVKTYPGDVQAVKGISFQVAPGEAFGLLGPNGAGKTTTIGMLNTTVTPSSGRAFLGGHDVAEDPLRTRALSSVVFQDSVVDQPLTGRQNLDLHLKLWGMRDGKTRAAELSDAVGITEILDRPVATYSGGQRRRMEIVRALTSNPEILFLDEPTVGLDTRIRYELLDLISGLRERTNMTTLLTTHYLDEAERLCDRIAIVHVGRIVALDTPANLLGTLGREILEVRVDGDPQHAIDGLRIHGIAGDDAFAVGATLTVPLHDRVATEVLHHLTDMRIGTSAVTTRQPTLDDVYLQLTGDSLAA